MIQTKLVYSVRYRRAENLIELPDGSLAFKHKRTRPLRATGPQRRILNACPDFRFADEIEYHFDVCAADLESMTSAGLLESDRQLLEACRKHRSSEPVRPVTDLGILTCQAPVTLERGLRSWFRNVAATGRQVRYTIIDDSPDTRQTAEYGEVIARSADELSIDIDVWSLAERRRFAAELAAAADVDKTIVEFALCGPAPPRVGIGASRNILQLLTIGRCVLSADDDTAARIVAPDCPDRSAWITSGDAPEKTHYFESEGDLADTLEFSTDIDLLGASEAWTGRSLADAISDHEGYNGIIGANHGLTHALRVGDARITATCYGLAGDAASDCLAFFNLVSTGEERQQFLARPGPFPASREVLRYSSRTFLSQGASLMTYCYTFDNTRFLPPFFPVDRGEDQSWQKVLHWVDPSTLIASIPLAVSHRPTRVRRYSEDDYLGLFATFPANAFLLGAIESCPRPYTGLMPEENLEFLADYLQSSSSDPQAFKQLLRAAWRAYLEHHLALVVAAGEQKELPGIDWWADAIRRVRRSIEQSLAHPGNVPFEYHGKTGSESIELFRCDLGRYAAMLRAWPRLRSAAMELSLHK